MIVVAVEVMRYSKARTMTVKSFVATLYLIVSSLILLIVTLPVVVVECAETVGTNGKVFRHDHLDYLDVDTVKYYIENTQETLDYDVAIMFYAQWSSHCHTLAPMWDQISRVLQAGTKSSKIMIGLFDCEDSKEHEAVCQQLHIKQYPTLAYFSMAGKKHHLSMKSPKHVTQFKGNWQYGDAILDWVRAVSALSQYHRSGWGNKVRNMIFGSSSRNKKMGRDAAKQTAAEQLPVGVPQTMSDTLELQSLRKEMNQTVSLAVRTSAMMQVLFVPVRDKDHRYPILSDSHKNYTDMYAMLQDMDAWGKQSLQTTNMVLRTCVTELTMDYCDRMATQYMESWIDTWPLNQTITDEVFDEYQYQMSKYINQTEPQCQYYVVQNVCTVSNFTNPLCQPKTCPFQDRTACRFLTACLTESLQTEYAAALQRVASTTSATEQQQKQSKKEKKSGGFSWGL